MWKQFKGRALAAVLSAAMLLTIVPLPSVRAKEEGGAASGSGQTAEAGLADEKADSPIVPVEYLVVSNPVVEVPGEEKIVVSFGADSAVETAVLTYRDAKSGETAAVRSDVIQDGTAVFAIPFPEGSQPGVYDLVSIAAAQAGTLMETDLVQAGISAQFGVGVPPMTKADAVVVDEEQEKAMEAGQATAIDPEEGKSETPGTNFLTIDESGQLEENADVAEAISSAGETLSSDSAQPPRELFESTGNVDEASVKPMSYVTGMTRTSLRMAAAAVTDKGEASVVEAAAADTATQAVGAAAAGATVMDTEVSSESRNMVIVLDPGHGGFDSGAVGVDGAREKDLTMKIARYCKAELEKYDGVTVYLTRDGDTAAGGATNVRDDLINRVKIAKEKKADVLVSIHLNATFGGSGGRARGAEVYYPNRNYRPDISTEGQDLAAKIESELVGLGLANRGVMYKDSTDGESWYDDGSLMDYYYVIWASKEAGFPGIIVEHAFIDNQSDYYTFLSTDAKLQALGAADAKGIAAAYKLGTGSWVKDEKGWRWKHANGTYSTGKWESIGGSWYYFGNDGYAVTNEQTIGGAKYYFDPSSCAMLIGWRYAAGKWYYYNTSGKMVTSGWSWINGKCYYFGADGVMASDQWIGNDYVEKGGAWIPGRVKGGWIQSGNRMWYRHSDGSYTRSGWELIEGKWYYFDQYGWMKTGWLYVGGTWYYLKDNGEMATGWQKIGGVWYYMESWGGMATGWKYTGGAWYYLESWGGMATGWKHLGSTWYYLQSWGGMATGWQKIGGTWYYMESSGAMATGWRYMNGKWYYFHGWGGMATGWQSIGGSWYYLYDDGVMAADQWVGGYYLDGSGRWIPGKDKLGWAKDQDGWSYYPVKGQPVKGDWEYINGAWYYFDTDGYAVTGWKEIGGQTYYFDQNSCAMKKGWLELDGQKYFLRLTKDEQGKEGSLVTGYFTVDGTKYYFNENPTTSIPLGAQTKEPPKGEEERELMPIMGKTGLGDTRQAAVKKMVDMYGRSKKSYPGAVFSKGGAADITAFCEIMYDEATAEGVRPEVVFGQSMMETGYLQFGGDVKPEQFNFAGLGATGGGNPGLSFANVRTGIRAQVQHLKAYASTDPLKQECVDPRFKYVKRGSAVYVEWLGIKENPNGGGWAGSPMYGYNLVDLYINPMFK